MAERNLSLLQELRYVAHEVGYREARRMPVEVRRWWIGEMQKEAQRGQGPDDGTMTTGRRRTADVK